MLLLGVLWSWPAIAQAQPEISYLPDNKSSIEAIAQTPPLRWQPLEGDLLLGFTAKPHWIRIVLPALLKPHYLVISNPSLDYLRIFQLIDGKWTNTIDTGNRLAYAQRPMLSRNFIVPLAAVNAEQTVYIWAQTDGILHIPIEILSPETLAQSDQHYLLTQGMYYGFFLAIAVFAAFLWANHKESTYGLFGLLMLAYAAVEGVLSGLAFAYVWPDLPALNQVAMPICLAAAVALAARFAISVLRLLPAEFGYYACQGAFYCGLILLLASPFLPLAIALKACLLLVAGHCVLQACLGVFWLSKHRPGSGYYCAASAVFLIGAFIASLSFWGFIEVSTAYRLCQVAGLVQTVLLTFLIFSRVKRAYSQRLADEFARRTQQSMAMAQEQAQAHALAQAVAQKTAALQEALSEVNKLNLELSKQTITDSLTGLFNRRHFDHLLENEVRRAAREHRSISLVLIDVDHFKKINDTYGHPVGDDCLIQLARLLRHIVRQPPDILFRSGGEEMALLLPGSDSAGALVVAEKICSLVAASEFCYPAGCLQLTLSLGVGSLVPSLSTQARELFELADKALYLAKNGGRNRVESLSLGNREPVDWG